MIMTMFEKMNEEDFDKLYPVKKANVGSSTPWSRLCNNIKPGESYVITPEIWAEMGFKSPGPNVSGYKKKIPGLSMKIQYTDDDKPAWFLSRADVAA